MILWATGCFGVVPFQNEPPELVAVNGAATEDAGTWSIGGEPLVAGGQLRLVVEVDDPESDEVRVWFPYTRGWVDFDPDAREGVWYLPEDPADLAPELILVLEDDRDPPAYSTWYLEFPCCGDGSSQ